MKSIPVNETAPPSTAITVASSSEGADLSGAELSEAIAELHGCLDLPGLAGAVERILHGVAGCTDFTIVVCNENSARLDIIWPEPDGLGPTSLSGGAAERESPAVLRGVLETGQSFVSFDGECPKAQLGGRDLPVAACLPLQWEGATFGLLVLHELDSRAETEAISSVVRHVGLSLARLLIYRDACNEAVDSVAKLEAVESLGDALSETRLEAVLARILELSLDVVVADVGAIILQESDGSTVPVSLGLEPDDIYAIKAIDDTPLAKRVIESGEPVFVPDVRQTQEYTLDDATKRIGSLVCVPLNTKERCLGAMMAVSPSPDAGLTHADMELLSSVSGLAATMIENAVLHKEALLRERMSAQMSIAADIQRSLQPDGAPELERFELAGWSDPCDETGGDYFDYVDIDDSRLVAIVGDVTDHGIGAALLMTTARAFLLSLLHPGCRLPEVFATVNELLEADMTDGRFMTVVATELDKRTQTMRYTSAGHCGPLVYRATSEAFEEFDSTGLPLGIIAGSSYPCSEAVQLQPGDTALLFTDGVWEAHDAEGEQFGRDRLKDVVRMKSGCSAEEIAAAIREAVRGFLAGTSPADDATIVVIKATG